MKDHADPSLWLSLAFSYLKTDEIKGAAANKDILNFFRDVGHAHVKSDEIPWCAAFVGSVFEQVNIRSTQSLMARSYLEWGDEISTPKMGAVAILKRGSDKTKGHVGFLLSSSENELQLLGGNQSDMVSISTYPYSRLLGFRWPNVVQINSGEDVKLSSPNFDIALRHVLQMEGGWSNHKDDKGGPTNKGITLKTYKRALKERVIDTIDLDVISGLKNISDEEIRTIYKVYYWQASGCPNFPLSVSLLHFDAAVNHGVTRAVKFLQRAVGAVIDGEIGPETFAKTKMADWSKLLFDYVAIRDVFYRGLSQFPIFGKGWINRLNDTEALAKTYINEDIKNKLVRNIEIDRQQPKAKEPAYMSTETKSSSQKWWGESLTVWGTIITALSTILPVIGPFIGFDISAELITQFGETVAKLIQIAGGLTGTTMALYGRARADGKLIRRAVQVKL